MPVRHDQVLKAISRIAELLIQSSDWKDTIQSVLAQLGESLRVSRVYLFDFQIDAAAGCFSTLQYEWVEKGVAPQIDNPELQDFSWQEHRLAEWLECLQQGEVVTAHVDDIFMAETREHFVRQDIASLLLMPIICEGEPWGFLGFDACHARRDWQEGEIDVLRAAANMLGGTIRRVQVEHTLERANERYRLAEDAGNIGTWDWNLITNELYWSDATKGIYGLNTEEFDNTYESFLACVHPDDRDSLEEAVSTSIRQRSNYQHQFRTQWRDGTIRWILGSGNVYLDAEGQVVRMVGVVQDITEDVRVQTALKRSEQRFRGLVESVNDWIWEVDAEGRYTYVSAKVKQFLGYAPDEVLGKTPFDMMEASEARRMRGIFGRIMANKESFTRLRNYNLHRDGHEVILESSGVPIINSSGELLGYRGVDRDITHRVQTEKKLHDSEVIFGHFANNAREMFWIRDMQKGEMIYVSPAYEKIWGDRVENLYRDPNRLARFVHPDDRQRINKAIAEGMKTGEYDEEYRIVRPDGEVRWIHSRKFPVVNSRGEIHRVAGAAEDITERKMVEQSNLQHERHQKEALVREVHHRIKNNLQGIVGLLRQQLSGYPELEDVLNRVINQVQSISVIYGLQGRSQSVYLCEVVHAIGHSVNETFGGECSVDIRLEHAQPFVLAEEDAVPVALIINELLTNAIKHGQEGGSIKLVSQINATQAQICVRNRLTAAANGSEQDSQDGGSTGMGLIRSLMPRKGARIHFKRTANEYEVLLELEGPVIQKRQEYMREPFPDDCKE